MIWENMSNTWKYRSEKTCTRFFHKQRFFLSQAQCCLTFSWIELQMLLRSCLIVTHFAFSIFVSMSMSRSIFILSIWSTFHFQPDFLCNQPQSILLKQRYICFCTFFWNTSYYFWKVTLMNKANNFQIAQVQP